MNDGAESASLVPLVVDMDGTLIKVDSLHEAFVQFTLKRPLAALRAALWVRHGRAAFKAAIPDFALIETGPLPVEETVFEAIRHARECGRKVYLATAADRRFAVAVANAVGGFDGIFASERGINLKGQAKADCLIATFGNAGFDYIGNDVADVPAWRAARTALVSGASSAMLKKLRAKIPDLVALNLRRHKIGAYARALRPHQWLKNVLVAIPAIGAHDLGFSAFVTISVAFLSFSLAASSVYLVDDMIDLRQDRLHPQERYLPIAAGVVPLSHSIALLACVSSLSVALAFSISWKFILIVFAYIGLSASHSLYLNRKPTIDIVALVSLYGIRVAAGCAVVGITPSHWLVGFCFFFFLCLALLRRTGEAVAWLSADIDSMRKRGYRRETLPVMRVLTAASGFLAVLILAFYINAPEVRTLYRYPELLWGSCAALIYWLGRVYLLSDHGNMREDPLIFAGTDCPSILAGILIVGSFLAAL